MAVPYRKVSKTRKRLRRTHFKLEVTGLVKCPNCGEMIQSHRVCQYCGFYDGKKVVGKVEEEKVVEAKPAKKAPRKAKATKEAPVEEATVVEEVKPVKKAATKKTTKKAETKKDAE